MNSNYKHVMLVAMSMIKYQHNGWQHNQHILYNKHTEKSRQDVFISTVWNGLAHRLHVKMYDVTKAYLYLYQYMPTNR